MVVKKRKDEKKFKKMEKERPDALEMAKKTNEERKAKAKEQVVLKPNYFF